MEVKAYDQSLIIKQNVEYQFPDFKIEYLGTKEIEIPKHLKASNILHSYKVTDNNGKVQTYEWSSGSGLLIPLKFEVSGTWYEFLPFSNKPTFISKSRVQNETVSLN